MSGNYDVMADSPKSVWLNKMLGRMFTNMKVFGQTKSETVIFQHHFLSCQLILFKFSKSLGFC